MYIGACFSMPTSPIRQPAINDPYVYTRLFNEIDRVGIYEAFRLRPNTIYCPKPQRSHHMIHTLRLTMNFAATCVCTSVIAVKRKPINYKIIFIRIIFRFYFVKNICRQVLIKLCLVWNLSFYTLNR